jgi:hypothetical protein
MGPVLLVLQAVSGPPAPVPARSRVADEQPCPRGPGGEVVVCARSPDQYRLKPLADRYVEPTALPRAEIGVLGDSKMSLEAERGADAQGGTINRAMVRLKIPLGGKRKE